MTETSSANISVGQSQLEILAENLRDVAFVMVSQEGEVLTWNKGAEQLQGYTDEEIIGINYDCFFIREDIDLRKPCLILETAAHDGRYELEGWFVRKDGTRFWGNMVVVAIPAEEDGKLTGFHLILKDLSLLKHNEQILKDSLKESANIKHALDVSTIVAITDHYGAITSVNEAFCRISKYTREELIGQNHRIINSGYHPVEFFQGMWKTIAQGKIWRGEIKNKAKDGSFYWVNTTIVPILSEYGKPQQYIAIRHEITRRKQVEAEIRLLNQEMEQRIIERTAELEEANQKLEKAFSQLQESEQFRSTFISALTHDLRTPLVAQERALELFESNKDKLPEKLGKLADQLYKSNQGLLHMVNMLLETYQYEVGQARLVLETIDLNKLVSECFEEVACLAESKKIKLSNQLAQDLPSITGDSHELKRVFMNLIGNAIQNIPDGSNIKIKAKEKEGFIEIEVCDDGPGIPPEMLPHLFKRYFVGDHTRKKIGTGLGLYICSMIMELHQGDIRVESNPTDGTTFYLRLPLQINS